MGLFKGGSKIKTATVVKALDDCIGKSKGLADFIGCIVVLSIGALLGTEIKLPSPDSENVSTGEMDDVAE